MVQGLRGIRGLVDHGRHEHHAVDAELLQVAGVAHRLGQAGFGDAAEHLHTASDHAEHGLHDLALLDGGHRLVLTQRSEEHEAGDAAADQDVHMGGGSLEVERTVLVQLRGDGGEDTGPKRLHVGNSIPGNLRHGLARGALAGVAHGTEGDCGRGAQRHRGRKAGTRFRYAS